MKNMFSKGAHPSEFGHRQTTMLMLGLFLLVSQCLFAVVCGRLWSFAVVFVVVCGRFCGRLRSFVVVCGRFCGRLRSLFGYIKSLCNYTDTQI